jgi:hypothetical protein
MAERSGAMGRRARTRDEMDREQRATKKQKTGIEMHNFWRKACFRLVHGNACFHEFFGDFQQIMRLV